MDLEALVALVRADLENTSSIEQRKIYTIINQRMQEHPDFQAWTLRMRRTMLTRVFQTLNGYGILETPLAHPEITEVMVNGLEGVFVEVQGKIIPWPEFFTSSLELERVIHRMVSKVNRVVNTAQPIVDGRLEDGSRIHVVMPPIALNGPILTIRKFSGGAKNLEQLLKLGALSHDVANYLEEQVLKRRNILVSGGTGTGKTTLLNILSQWLSPSERVVTVEDACELMLSHLENWVRLEMRQGSCDNIGAVTMRQLVRASLRMRPDRIIVGEVRGEEVLDMLQAMNTGHEGSMSTVHANSAREVLTRLETLLNTHTTIGLEAIREMIVAGVDILVHLAKDRQGKRYVQEICELDKTSRQQYLLNSIYVAKGSSDGH